MPLFDPSSIAQYASQIKDDDHPPIKQDRAYQIAQMLLAGATGADIGTTLKVLNNGTESNPIYGEHPSAARLIGTKAAMTLPAFILAHKLHDEHPKLAKALLYGSSIAPLFATAHNISQK